MTATNVPSIVLTVALSLLWATVVVAQPLDAQVVVEDLGAVRVADINPGREDGLPSSLGVLGDTLLFRADDGEHGYELWASDGTPAGTRLVRDINPGGEGSYPGFGAAATVGGQVFFSADDGEHGSELWASDGTEAGTRLVRDINPGGQDSHSHLIQLTAVGEEVFFSAAEGEHGSELWASDGTAAGTRLVRDIYPGANGSFLSQFTAVADDLFFAAYDGVHGQELWVSGGTAATTRMVADANAGPEGSNPQDFVAFDGRLFYSAETPVFGRELWASDGTEEGTNQFFDFVPGNDSGFPEGLTVMGDTLFFSVTTGPTGRELWATNGSFFGTRLVADIHPGTSSSDPVELTPVGDLLFLRADDGGSGWELWVTDGTDDATRLVSDIWPGETGSQPSSLTAVGELLFFSTDDEVSGRELWVSDGTGAGTRRVADIRPGPAAAEPFSLTAVGDILLFGADDGVSGRELWRTALPPGPPTTVAAEAGDQHARVSWAAPANDGGAPVQVYRVESSPDGQAVEVGADTTEALVGGLANGTAFTFTVTARNAVGSGPPSTSSPPVTPQPPEPPGPTEPPEPSPTPEPPEPTGEPQPPEGRRVLRWYGSGRAETAARVSAEAYADGAAVAYVATGLGFADALAGGPAAALDGGGPILLVTRDTVPEATRAELTRLNPDRVVVFGGTGVVSDQVAEQAGQAAGAPVSRLSGPDRFATAAAVSRASFDPGVDAVFVATGLAFPDALAGGAAAAALGGPVLLVTPDTIPDATAAELSRLHPEAVYVLGGSAAVSPDVAAQVEALAEAPLTRLSGPDRFATAAAVAEGVFADADATFVATGLAFPDALAGVPAAAVNAAPLLLVATDALPAPTLAQLDRLDPGLVVILGGTAAVSAQVEQDLAR